MKIITTALLLLTPFMVSAQDSAYGGKPNENYILWYFLGLIAAIIVCIFITRAIFSIPKFLKYEFLQTKLQIIDMKAKYKDNEFVMYEIKKAIEKSDIKEDLG